MTYLSSGQATNEAMRLAMRADPRVFVLGEDVRFGGSFGVYRGLFEEFGDRVVDTPISEAMVAGAAVGAAITGMRPVAYLGFVEFAMAAMDEIVNQAAKLRYMSGDQISIPVVFRISDGALGSAAAQHSESLEALFAHVPGLKVVTPSNPADAKGLLLAAIRDQEPVIFLENKRIQPLKGEVPEGYYETPLGEASVAREGKDVTIVAYSSMALRAQEAAARLAAEDIDAEVIDLRSLKPFDLAAVEKSVTKTKRAVVCHEAWRFGGLGAEIAATISEELFDQLEAPVLRVGARNVHIPFAPILESEVVPSVDDVVNAVRLACGRRWHGHNVRGPSD